MNMDHAGTKKRARSGQGTLVSSGRAKNRKGQEMAQIDIDELPGEYWHLHLEYFHRSYGEDFDLAFHDYFREELHDHLQAAAPEDHESAYDQAREAALDRAHKWATEKANEYADTKLAEYMAANP